MPKDDKISEKMGTKSSSEGYREKYEDSLREGLSEARKDKDMLYGIIHKIIEGPKEKSSGGNGKDKPREDLDEKVRDAEIVPAQEEKNESSEAKTAEQSEEIIKEEITESRKKLIGDLKSLIPAGIGVAAGVAGTYFALPGLEKLVETCGLDVNSINPWIVNSAKGASYALSSTVLGSLADGLYQRFKNRANKNRVEVSRVKIDSKLFLNKWWAVVPGCIGAAAGIAGACYLAPGLENVVDNINSAVKNWPDWIKFMKYPVEVGKYLVYSGIPLGTALLTDRLFPLNKENWYAQGRIKWLLGQKAPWIGREHMDAQIIAKVYKKDFRGAVERDGWGYKIKENDGKPIPTDKSRWYFIGFIARKIPRKIDKDELYEELDKYELEVRERIKNSELNDKDLTSMLKRRKRALIRKHDYESNYAHFNKYYFISKDNRETEKDMNIEVSTIEDIEREIVSSQSAFSDFDRTTKKGKGCLAYTSFNSRGEPFISVEEMKKPRGDLWKTMWNVPWKFMKDSLGFLYRPMRAPRIPKAIKEVPGNIVKVIDEIPKYFVWLGGRYYNVNESKSSRRWFLEKDPIRSWIEGPFYDLRLTHNGESVLKVDERRVKSFLYSIPAKIISLNPKRKCPQYYLKIFDNKSINEEDEIYNNPNYHDIIRYFSTHVLHIDEDSFNRKHNLRYGYYYDKENKRTNPDYHNPKRIRDKGELERFRAEKILKR